MVRAVVVFVRDGTEVARWPLHVPGATFDLATIDQLARMQLTAKRLGGEIRITGVCARARALLELSGLGDWVEMER